MTDNDIITHVREGVRKALPGAIERALESYTDFSTRPFPLDPKEYDQHHKACKAALAHLDALTKMVTWLEKQEGQDGGSPSDETLDLRGMLLQARGSLVG